VCHLLKTGRDDGRTVFVKEQYRFESNIMLFMYILPFVCVCWSQINLFSVFLTYYLRPRPLLPLFKAPSLLQILVLQQNVPYVHLSSYHSLTKLVQLLLEHSLS
jgi:hypothetical protein